MAASALVGVLVVYASILTVDAYETVWFSPPLDRQPILGHLRYSAPGLARKARFDSAIVGSSTARLLAPRHFDDAFGASFVNISINGAGPIQQNRVLDVFVRHHPRPKAVVLALDHPMWCGEQAEDEQPLSGLPDLLYDDNRWNELPLLLSRRVLSATFEQFAYLVGLMPQKWGKDGFSLFPLPSYYDPVRVHDNLYGKAGPKPFPPVTEPIRASARERAGWRFDTLPRLDRMLDSLPDETLKIVFLVPTHRVLVPPPHSLAAARIGECGRRLGATAARRPNAHALDFVKDSPTTRRDDLFWDTVHFTVDAAEEIQRLIVDGVQFRRSEPGLFDYLGPGDAAEAD
ncbi:MAG: hypothetical protein L6R19_27930 [Alphaproteobacteria bacterium]|nr:hypothetical protein [Alphaproteobacteria bacterium]